MDSLRSRQYLQSFPAALQQRLLDAGETNKGVIVCEG